MRREPRAALRRTAIGWVVLAAVALAAGCGGANRPSGDYQLSGRVLDAETKKPLAQARLLFQALLPSQMGPPCVIKICDIAGLDGTYRINVPAGYDAMRTALAIRIDAALAGYTPAGTELPPPTEKKDVYEVPDLLLQKVAPRVPWNAPPKAAPTTPRR